MRSTLTWIWLSTFWSLIGCGTDAATPKDSQDNTPICEGAAHYQNGRCVPNSPPSSWTCSASAYGSVDGCDCGCGFADPDCVWPLSLGGCTRAHCTGNATPEADDPTRCEADTPPQEWLCDASYLGDGNCDCGCGAPDTDCPSPTQLSDCAYESCPNNQVIDPVDPSQCLANEVPTGWACAANTYGDGLCDCGCGIKDSDCASTATLYDCGRATLCGDLNSVDPGDITQCKTAPSGWRCAVSQYAAGGYAPECNCGCGIPDPDCGTQPTPSSCSSSASGCRATEHVDPADISKCLTNPAGWTCAGRYLSDGRCTCGCGVVDPECPTPLTYQACQTDACSYGKGIDPFAPTTCISNAPQDSWTCNLNMFYDGATCDCGCGSLDPDCPTAATAAECSSVNCGAGNELKAGSITTCVEHCEPLTGTVGTGTCTNGGMVEIFGNCNYHLSACGDGHSYEVECDSDGTCYCRVDSSCVLATTGSCMGVQSTLNSVCGWSLVDHRY